MGCRLAPGAVAAEGFVPKGVGFRLWGLGCGV